MKPKRQQTAGRESVLPSHLPRAPVSAQECQRDELDAAGYAAVERVASKIQDGGHTRVNWARAELLRSVKRTHRAMVALLGHGEAAELGAEIMPLARGQVERLAIVSLLADDGERWSRLYWKNLWRTTAMDFLNSQARLGKFKEYSNDYGDAKWEKIVEWGKASVMPGGAFGCELSENEITTALYEIRTGSIPKSHKQYRIMNMPSTPAKAARVLQDEGLRSVITLFRPHYSELCHHAHAGLGSIMTGGIVGGRAKSVPKEGRENFLQVKVVYAGFLVAFTALVTAATILGRGFVEPETRAVLMNAWHPYTCDAHPIGIEVWDAWAKIALGALG